MSEVQVRVGDRERTEVDAALRDALADGVLTLIEYDERAAACWAARTRADLDALLVDLPRRPAPVAATTSGPRSVTAVLSESVMDAPVAPGQPVTATAVLGQADVDLRREDLPERVDVRAVAVMGEVRVHVPPGTCVELTGQAVMGERKTRVGPPVDGGPVVHVHATAVMGTVTVDDEPRKQGLLPAVREHLTGHGTGHALPPPRSGSVPVTTHRRRLLPRLGAALVPVALVGAGVFGVSQLAAADQRAVFGSSEQMVQPDDLDGTYEVGVAFGSVTVVVPEGVRARLTGTMVFGSSECGEACRVESDRVLTIDATGAFGSVEVVTEAEADEDRGGMGMR